MFICEVHSVQDLEFSRLESYYIGASLAVVGVDPDGDRTHHRWEGAIDAHASMTATAASMVGSRGWSPIRIGGRSARGVRSACREDVLLNRFRCWSAGLVGSLGLQLEEA